MKTTSRILGVFRGAPRLRRGAPSVGGLGGPVARPPMSSIGVVGLGMVVLLAAWPVRMGAQPAIDIGGTDLGGVVTSASGAEAGVWVIAETTDLPTKFAKIVYRRARPVRSSRSSQASYSGGCGVTGSSTRRRSGPSPGNC